MFNKNTTLSEGTLSTVLSGLLLIYALHSHMILTMNQIKFGSFDCVSFWDFELIWTWNTNKTCSYGPTRKETEENNDPALHKIKLGIFTQFWLMDIKIRWDESCTPATPLLVTGSNSFQDIACMGTRRHISIFSQLFLSHKQLKWQISNMMGTQLYPNTILLTCLPGTTSHWTHPNPSSLLNVHSPIACFTSASFSLTEAFCLLMLVPHSQGWEQALETAGFWQKLESQDVSALKYLSEGSVCSSTKCLRLDRPGNCCCCAPLQQAGNFCTALSKAAYRY